MLAEVSGNRFQLRLKAAVDFALSLVYNCVIAAGMRGDGLDLLLDQLCNAACVATCAGLLPYFPPMAVSTGWVKMP